MTPPRSDHFNGKTFWFVGDSGYNAELFRRTHHQCGSPDPALVPIGAYEPRWFMTPMRMNPAESVQLHRDVGARTSLAMHWGTFQLTDEGSDEPVAAPTEAHVRPPRFLRSGARFKFMQTKSQTARRFGP